MPLAKYQSWANSDPRNYHTVLIPKSDGSYRKLWIASPPLRAIQRMVLDEILCSVTLHPRAIAYRQKRSIAHLAIIHTGCLSLLKVDIDNFFPSIQYRLIQRCLLGAGTPNPSVVAGICTVWDGNNRILPQGTVTAAAISNIVSLAMDRRLHALAQCYGLQYSRYADDMVFSSHLPVVRWGEIVLLVQSIVLDEGFIIKSSKTQQGERCSFKSILGVEL